MVAKSLVTQRATLGVSNEDVQGSSPSSPIVSIELSKNRKERMVIFLSQQKMQGQCLPLNSQNFDVCAAICKQNHHFFFFFFLRLIKFTNLHDTNFFFHYFQNVEINPATYSLTVISAPSSTMELMAYRSRPQSNMESRTTCNKIKIKKKLEQ